MTAMKSGENAVARAISAYPWSLMGFLLLCMVVPKLYEWTYLFWAGRVSANALSVAEQHEFLAIAIEVINEATAVGVLSLVAQANGRRDGVLGALRSGLFIALLGSCLLSLMLWIAPQSCIRVMGTPPALVSASCVYLRLRACGLPFDAVGIVLLTTLKALGRARQALAIVIAGMLLNAGLDVLTISDTRLSLHLGISGMAIGFVLSRAATCVLAAIACRRAVQIRGWDLLAGLSRLAGALPGFLSTGGWAGMDSLVRNLGYAAMLTVLNALDAQAFAAYGLAMTIIWTAILPILALTEGTNIVVGTLFGRQQHREIDRTLLVSLVLAVGIMIVLLLLGVSGWRLVAGFLNPHIEITEASYKVFLSLAVAYLLFAVSQILKSLFIGTGRTVNLFLVSLIVNVLFVLPFVVFARRAGNQVGFTPTIRAFAAGLIFDFLLTVILAVRLRRLLLSSNRTALTTPGTLSIEGGSAFGGSAL